MKTLFLNPETWDLELDVSGNIAVASDVYQQAQDICSAGRTFTKDLYFDQAVGIPYLDGILGAKGFPLSLYKKYIEDAAVSVTGVTSAHASLRLVANRTVTGTITFTNENNQTGSIAL